MQPLTSWTYWKCGELPFFSEEDSHDDSCELRRGPFWRGGFGTPTADAVLGAHCDRIYRHPGGTLPAKLHEPKDYKAMDRLMDRPEVTHATVIEAHRQQTLTRMRQAKGVVLVRHDTTELEPPNAAVRVRPAGDRPGRCQLRRRVECLAIQKDSQGLEYP